MKYGLIYYKNTHNLGDDILSYVGKKFLPKVDYYIDREHLMYLFLMKKSMWQLLPMVGFFTIVTHSNLLHIYILFLSALILLQMQCFLRIILILMKH